MTGYGKRRISEEMEEQLEKIQYFQRMLDQYVSLMELFNGEELYWKLILRRAFLNTETAIRWAKKCLDAGIGEKSCGLDGETGLPRPRPAD